MNQKVEKLTVFALVQDGVVITASTDKTGVEFCLQHFPKAKLIELEEK